MHTCTGNGYGWENLQGYELVKPWLKKAKAYMKHALMEKVAWGNMIACLEVLEEESERNQFL